MSLIHRSGSDKSSEAYWMSLIHQSGGDKSGESYRDEFNSS